MPHSESHKREIKALFRKMLKAIEDMDEDEALRLYSSAKAVGLSFSIKTKETTSWEELDDVNYATVTQRSQLFLGDVQVAKWKGDYFGTYGCMGTGWWIDCIEGDGIDPDLDELMGLCGIYPEAPAVPEPVRLRESDD